MQIPVFVINLDRRPDRWATMAEQFERLDIEATRIPAIDARLLSVPAAIRNRRKWGSQTGDPGSIACNRSHATALRAFLDTDAPAALILEDDVELAADSPSVLGSVAWWPPGARVIRLEAEYFMTPVLVPLWGPCAETPSGRTVHYFERWHPGAAAYLVNRAMARWMLPHLDDPANPGTDCMWFNHRYCPLARELKALQIVPGMARQIEPLEQSDLEPYRPQNILSRERRGLGAETGALPYRARLLALRALGTVRPQHVRSSEQPESRP